MQLALMQHSVRVSIRRQDKSAILYGVDAEMLLLDNVSALCDTDRVFPERHHIP